MKKLLIIILSGLSLLAQAQVQVQVEPSHITRGQHFQLTLTQSNIQDSDLPDLTVLSQDFSILGTEQRVNYSVINGQAQSSSQWLVTLQAKKSGILTIPAITVGSNQSSPVTINVSEATPNQDLQTNPTPNEEVTLTAKADNKKPYINQQIIYSVQLFNRKRLLDADYQAPEVDNALIIPMGDVKRYQTTLNNMEYVVEEQHYAIFPQKSGTVTIVSPVFSALIYGLNPEPVKVQDKPTTLKVQPIPKDYKGANWLPAKQITLSEHYENTNQTINQGSTLIRTIRLEGIGLPAQLLPQLQITDGKAFNVYLEKGKEHNRFLQGDLVGSLETKVTYLFKESGKVMIPELKISWFNTTTGKEVITTLPPRSMELTPVAAAPLQTNPVHATENKSIADTHPIITAPSSNWAWAMALLFALAWITTLGLWFWQRPRGRNLKGHYKKALEEVTSACNECKPAKARDALLTWAGIHWPDAPVLNLTDLSKLVRDAHLKNQLNLLSQALYKNNERTLWRGDELARSIQALSRVKPTKKKQAKALPPINPGN
ncbi:MAG: BatD family protein [Legionellales bacterium]